MSATRELLQLVLKHLASFSDILISGLAVKLCKAVFFGFGVVKNVFPMIHVLLQCCWRIAIFFCISVIFGLVEFQGSLS